MGSAGQVAFFTRKTGATLAYIHENRGAPGAGVFWLSGLKSDMRGTKAGALAGAARATGRRCLRFDYSGHGASQGNFADCAISDWLADTVQMFLGVARGEQIIVGSSMGGYLALLLAKTIRQHFPQELWRIKGMVLIAPAPDMTEDLMWGQFDEPARREIEQRGQWLMPSAYGDGYVITRRLIEDGRRHLILNEHLLVDFPVRILHGMEDPDVPWRHGLKLFERLEGEDVRFTLIKGGDHRLSTARDLGIIVGTVEDLIKIHD
jgi:pimeloyl-ACP methyl ester carboxylesterase